MDRLQLARKFSQRAYHKYGRLAQVKTPFSLHFREKFDYCALLTNIRGDGVTLQAPGAAACQDDPSA
jgi:hypothetical protein